MLDLIKAKKETVSFKIVRMLLAATFLVVPLIFFTDLTANPFFAQNVLLYLLIAAIYGTIAFQFLRTQHMEVTKTVFPLRHFVRDGVAGVCFQRAASLAPDVILRTLELRNLAAGGGGRGVYD